MGVLIWIGIPLVFIFFIAWFVRNIFKYMYGRTYPIANRVLWWGLMPLSALGLLLIIIGAATGV